MYKLLFTLFFLIDTGAFAQDTISFQSSHNKYFQATIVHENDTTIHTFRPDSTLESVRPLKNGVYIRYYHSGEIMWKQERRNNQANGFMEFYSPENEHVCTLELRKDSVVDTIYLKTNRNFIYGRIGYSSIIHGGMRRPDGSSNISRSSGPKAFEDFFFVQHRNDLEASKYAEFSVDYTGYFFQILNKGAYGIFPASFDLNSVELNMGAPPPSNRSSHRTSWNVTSPIEITENYSYLSIMCHSIGYAP